MARRKTKRVRLFNKFIRLFILSFTVFTLLAAIGTFSYVLVAKNNIVANLVNKPVTGEVETEGLGELESVNPALDKHMTTLAIFGVDKEGYRTDVIMVGFFNHETKAIDFVSIPRDTKVYLPDRIYDRLSERRDDVTQIISINEIPAYEDPDQREATSVEVIESVFGVTIDYYVSMNLKAFKEVVDLVGPVPVEVPMDMDYEDPVQDLYIHLEKGYQELNGAQAEMLIRFRKGYGTGDIGRIHMQHDFMTSFVEVALAPKNRLNMLGILEQIVANVKTDFVDAVDYLVYLEDISVDKIRLHMLPGNVSGAGYSYDGGQTEALFESIVSPDKGGQGESEPEAKPEAESDPESASDQEPASQEVEVVVDPLIDSSELVFGVYNGTMVSGFAGRTSQALEEAGYQVDVIADYDTKPVAQTTLRVPAYEVGQDLVGFFTDPLIEIDESLLGQEVEVEVIIGENEEKNRE